MTIHKFFENWRSFVDEDQLDEASILKNKYPFKALFLLGPAGAGKSFISRNIGIPSDFQVSNPDERIEEVFPIFGISLKFADARLNPEDASLEILQQSSRKILQNANIGHTTNLIAKATPLIFDTTGEDTEKIGNKIENLVKIGYDVGVIVVNVPPEVSISRDQNRKRTVGAERTAAISKTFQDNVIIGQAYPKIASKSVYVDVLGEPYPNIFDLRNGEYLPGIEPEAVQKYPQFSNVTPKSAKQILANIKSDLSQWLNSGVRNPVGETILDAMRELVRSSNGSLGQNMNDIPVAVASGFGENPAVHYAAETLVDLSSSMAGVTGKKKKTGLSTIRGASAE